MLKILTKREYENLLYLANKAESLEGKVSELLDVCDDMRDENDTLKRENKILEKGQSVLLGQNTSLCQENLQLKEKLESFTKADENSVRIIISEDIETIRPVIAYRSDVFEGLFQAGLLNDAQENNQAAIQLALITVAHEALGQIVESFEAPAGD